MKERPILFSGPMVRAILDGSKTQARRVVKPQPSDGGLEWIETSEGFAAWQDGNLSLDEYSEDGGPCQRTCPYGQPGDLLWVRETWAHSYQCEHYNHLHSRSGSFVYRATNETCCPKKWRPSIHMPRRASRITLEMTGVRVEKVQDISEEDAKAEGVERQIAHGQDLGWRNYLWHGDFGSYGLGNKKSDAWDYQYSTYQKANDCFSSLWELINGKKPGCSWDDNPWVFVVEFIRI